MPFKSEAQRRLFWAKVNRGEISKETAKEWESATPKGKLPEHVKKGAMTKTAEPPPPPGVSVREWDERLMGDTPLTEGGQVELEHADTIRRIKEDPSITVGQAANMIADDHEEEHKGYYPALKNMEAELERTKKAAFWDELDKIALSKELLERAAEKASKLSQAAGRKADRLWRSGRAERMSGKVIKLDETDYSKLWREEWRRKKQSERFAAAAKRSSL